MNLIVMWCTGDHYKLVNTEIAFVFIFYKYLWEKAKSTVLCSLS